MFAQTNNLLLCILDRWGAEDARKPKAYVAWLLALRNSELEIQQREERCLTATAQGQSALFNP